MDGNSGVYVLDTETTGLLATDQVIELAYHQLLPLKELTALGNSIGGGILKLGRIEAWEYVVQRFNPTVPINKHAYAVHGLSKLQLIKEPSSLKAAEYLPKDMKYMLGYNIPFDYKMLGRPKDVLLIDLLAVVRKLRKEHAEWKKLELPDNKLDTYMKVMYPELNFNKQHSAKEDCIKSILLLCKVLLTLPEVDSWEDLYTFVNPKKEIEK